MKDYKIEYSTIESKVRLLPAYIDKAIDCINFDPKTMDENVNSRITFSYFSEYSSLNFFITISEKQLYFETYNHSGTPKPNLIFYVDDIDKKVFDKILELFTQNKKIDSLEVTDTNKFGYMITDQTKDNLGKQWGGDLFPLTKLEAESVVKRFIDKINSLTTLKLVFKSELIRPILYRIQLNEIEVWLKKYPELREHKLNY